MPDTISKYVGKIEDELTHTGGPKAQLNKQIRKVAEPVITAAEKDIENIFSPFYVTGDEKRHHSGVYEYRTAGIGLGLTIVKNIIELMGGTIKCESAKGKGSKFIFTVYI